MRESRVVLVLAGALGVAALAEYAVHGEPGSTARALRFGYPFAVALGAGWLLYGAGALPGIGLKGPVMPGLLWGALGVAPMAILLWRASGWSAPTVTDPLRLFEITLGAALREELVFRGLVFLALWRATRLEFKGAMLISALLFGAAHLPGLWARQDAGGLLTVLAITAAGGAFYAWLLAEWDSLWLVVVLHGGMNLVWALFAQGEGAVGSESANLGRAATIVFMVVLTDRRRRARNRA